MYKRTSAASGRPLHSIFTLNHNTETTTLNIFKLKGWGWIAIRLKINSRLEGNLRGNKVQQAVTCSWLGGGMWPQPKLSWWLCVLSPLKLLLAQLAPPESFLPSTVPPESPPKASSPLSVGNSTSHGLGDFCDLLPQDCLHGHMTDETRRKHWMSVDKQSAGSFQTCQQPFRWFLSVTSNMIELSSVTQQNSSYACKEGKIWYTRDLNSILPFSICTALFIISPNLNFHLGGPLMRITLLVPLL